MNHNIVNSIIIAIIGIVQLVHIVNFGNERDRLDGLIEDNRMEIRNGLVDQDNNLQYLEQQLESYLEKYFAPRGISVLYQPKKGKIEKLAEEMGYVWDEKKTESGWVKNETP